MATFDYTLSVTGDCQNQGSGAMSVSFFGGTPPYTINWASPINVTETLLNENVYSQIFNLMSGSYTFRVNDSSIPNNLEFNVNAPVSSGCCANILEIQNTTCGLNNGSVTVSSSSDYSTTTFVLFSYSGTQILSLITDLSQVTFNNLTAGTYYVQAVDYGGCTGTTPSFIINPSSDVDFGIFSVNDSQCNGPSGKLIITGQTGVPPWTYQWNNGLTGSTITGLTAGTYAVKVTDSNGCSKIKSQSVDNINPPGLGRFQVDEIPSCLNSDGAITLIITGGTPPYYYSASTGDFEVTYSNSFQLSGIPVGSYSFSVTDAAFCKFTTGTDLNSPNGISDIQINSTQSLCSNANGSIKVLVYGGVSPFTYTLVDEYANTQTIQTNAQSYIYNNLSASTYTVIVQDSSGCYYTQEETIFSDNTFTISTIVTGTTCSSNNGIILVQKTSGGTSPFNYSLDDVQNVIGTSASAVTFSNISAGQHEIKVSDASGCTQTIQVFVETSPQMSFNLYSTSCGDGSQGTITSFISSGTPPFTFDWSTNIPNNPQTIQVTGLTAGTYSVSITDNSGCTLKRSIGIDCAKTYVSFQTYVMGEEPFSMINGNKNGLSQMLNQGFLGLTSGYTGCTLVSAIFVVRTTLNPSGVTDDQSFYTATNLSELIPENLLYEKIEEMLSTFPGIASVNIDELTSQITIQSNPPSQIDLGNQELIIELIIIYDIDCLQ